MKRLSNMENKLLISILTPTYNRANLLPRLFNSLMKQTNYSFEWIIIDDGSTDNTQEIVDSFTNNMFSIKYIWKENGGKHTALNFGIQECRGFLTFIVDSDDWLTEDAIQSVINQYGIYKNTPNLCGISFLRQYPDGKINVTSGHEDGYIDSYNKVRIYEQRIGDMAEVYYTDILKKYLFPVFTNEKFIGEDIVWVEIGKRYNLVFINHAIYISDYLEGGLTTNRRKNNISSSNGSYARAKKLLEIKLPFIFKIKVLMQLYIYGKFSNKEYKEIKRDANSMWMSCIHFLSYLLYKKWVKDNNV